VREGRDRDRGRGRESKGEGRGGKEAGGKVREREGKTLWICSPPQKFPSYATEARHVNG